MGGASRGGGVVLYMLGTPRPLWVVGRTVDEFRSHPAGANEDLAADVAEGARDVPVSDVEELATGFVQFENGRTLTVDVAGKVHMGLPGGIHLAGTRAGARVFPLEL